MSRGRTAVALTAVAVLAAGCTDDGPDGAEPSISPSLSPTVTATTPAAQALQELAQQGVDARYRATYRARQVKPRSAATWRVWRSAQALRVDVVTRRAKATLIVTPHGSFSCRKAKHRKTCFRVAKGDDPVPAPFQLSAQRVFSSDLDVLARRADDLTVRAVEIDSTSGPVESVGCFLVRTTKDGPRLTARRVTYCLSEEGLLTRVLYANGNAVVLRSAHRGPPPHDAFEPYASPTPVPGR